MTLEEKIKKVERTIEILNHNIWNGEYYDIDEEFDHLKAEKKKLEKLKEKLKAESENECS